MVASISCAAFSRWIRETIRIPLIKNDTNRSEVRPKKLAVMNDNESSAFATEGSDESRWCVGRSEASEWLKASWQIRGRSSVKTG